jgi:hypothetical protein
MARKAVTSGRRLVRLRPVRLYRRRTAVSLSLDQPEPLPAATEPSAGLSELRPIPNGQTYRVESPHDQSLATPQLADALNKVLEQFAQSNGFSAEQPLIISFKRGTLGLHRFGRAADIYAVGGKGIGQWAHEWNEAMRKAKAATNQQERARLVDEERRRNLGYKLYKALQAHGGWAQPQGYPVQLFGPWTRGEGPHKTISDILLHAHRDHIHVAK